MRGPVRQRIRLETAQEDAPLTLRSWPLLLATLLSACSPARILNSTIDLSGLTITRDVAYEAGPRHGLDIYRPSRAAGPLPLVIFIYGGSWRMGSKATYPFVAATLARRGAVVMVPDYRLYPDVSFPDFLRDNAAAVAWALAHAPAYDADPHDLFLIGHSAGAYNAAMLALDPVWLRDAGYDRGKLAGVVGIAGPYNFLPIVDPDVIPVFAPVQDGPASQPITYVDGHNPPMLLLAGNADETVNPANTTSLAARIEQAGGPVSSKIYSGVGHIGIITAFAPLFRWHAPTLDDVWTFIRAHSPGSRTNASG